MATEGQLGLVLKFNRMPEGVRTVKNGWKEFEITCGQIVVTVCLRPGQFAQLTQAAATWPLWAATIIGKVGTKTAGGYMLAEPGVQVFEKKPKEAKVASLTGQT